MLLMGVTRAHARTLRSGLAQRPRLKVNSTIEQRKYLVQLRLNTGFNSRVTTLDSIESNIPTDGPVIILTASYEGEPPDNAGRFVEALKRTRKGALANVRFAVFGCGHHDWVHTYQKVPTLVDNLIEEYGGQRLLARAAGDSGADDFFDYVRE